MASLTNSVNHSDSSNSSALIQQNNPPWAAGLPLDPLTQILRHANASTIVACNAVCRQWNLWCKQDSLWQNLLLAHFPQTSAKTKQITNYCRAYQTLYYNLIHGIYGDYALYVLEGHEDWVWCLAVSGDRLISSSADTTIKIWNIITGKYTATLEGHEDTVYCLAIAADQLISGSKDTTIKIWDIITGKCTATLKGHEDSVMCLAVSGDRLISGSTDETIKIWDKITGKCTATLKGHEDPVSCLAISGDRLISGSIDATIKVWNIITGECTATLKEHKTHVSCLAISGDRLISGSEDTTIKIWDIITGNCTATLEGHKKSVNCLAISGDRLISGSDDTTIKIWDIITGDCTATFYSHEDPVTCLAISGGQLISGSEDNMIKIWDFTTDHDAIFEKVAELWESREPTLKQVAMQLFSKMPKRAKNQIYRILWDQKAETLKTSSPSSFGKRTYDKTLQEANEIAPYAQLAFETSPPAQKAQAIRKYVSENQPKSDVHPF